MKSTNRLEDNWSPKWELGLQDEFGFSLEVEAVEQPKLPAERPNAWSMAAREVLNRQSAGSGRSARDGSSLSEVVTFLEKLSVEIASDE